MRLWHIDLIPSLPRQQLLGQHRECCALRGLGWGRKHSTVNYVFLYSWEYLYDYHQAVIEEMRVRGYSPNLKWTVYLYRGKRATALTPDMTSKTRAGTRYPEHNDEYKKICIENLSKKIEKNSAKYSPADIYKWMEASALYFSRES